MYVKNFIFFNTDIFNTPPSPGELTVFYEAGV